MSAHGFNPFALGNPFGFAPWDVAAEMMRTGNKLAAGAQSLRHVGSIEFGVSPKEPVYRDGKLTLYRYQNPNRREGAIPLVIIYALVNRPYMVDLQADRSLVRGLLARGEDVYIIDWGYPDRSDRYLDLTDYVERFIHGCIEFICKQHGLPAINVLGVCQGGSMSLCYASLHPERVRNLVTMVTPVDFQTPDNMLSHWIQKIDADLMIDTLGNVSGDSMNANYLMLKPFRLNLQKYVGFTDTLEDGKAVEDFLRMEKWIFDSPDQAGDALRQFIKQFYQGNGFINGGIVIGGREVSLRNVKAPVLNIFAEQDHLVPPDASRALGKLVGTRDYTEKSFRGGHIGIYVSSRAQKEVPETICGWLEAR
jgi:polyhydroxyalkanoate synthase